MSAAAEAIKTFNVEGTIACQYMAKLAEQAERYDEMKAFMHEVSKIQSKENKSLTVEERNLLSVAYKNAVGSRRAAWRIVSSVEQKEKSKGNETHQNHAKTYREKIEKELSEICDEVIALLAILIEVPENDAESKVFYLKMAGDYYRYEAEFLTGDKKTEAASDAKAKYEEAMDAADGKNGKEGLVVTHPIRLGLALNFSVFHYEVLNQPDDACKMARSAFEGAIAELDNVSEDSYKDSTLIMQLLRDNLTLWTSDQEEQQ